MSEETPTNPVEDSDLLSEAEVEQDAIETNEDDSPELDDDGNPIEGQAEDDDTEEVEHEGHKYKVPKALKPALMMQADYTRKTQELAEQRKALEAQKAQYAEVSEEVVSAKAELVALDKTLAQYDQIDWRAWSTQDPSAAQAAFIEYQQLRDGRGKLESDVKSKTEALTLEAQRTRAKQLEEGQAVLAKDIPGWGSELAVKLADFGVKELGFAPAEVEQISDPRIVKLLHAAFQAKQTQATQAKVAKLQQAQKVTPAATVAAKGAPKAGLDDRLSQEEWLRRRTEQIRKRG